MNEALVTRPPCGSVWKMRSNFNLGTSTDREGAVFTALLVSRARQRSYTQHPAQTYPPQHKHGFSATKTVCTCRSNLNWILTCGWAQRLLLHLFLQRVLCLLGLARCSGQKAGHWLLNNSFNVELQLEEKKMLSLSWIGHHIIHLGQKHQGMLNQLSVLKLVTTASISDCSPDDRTPQ